jgi:Subtilase family
MFRILQRSLRGIRLLVFTAPLVAAGEPTDTGSEIPMIPNGAVADAGWALARLNDGGDMASQSFVYPETTNPVRLFLIDSGVAHTGTGTWFSQNTNLEVEYTETIGNPSSSAPPAVEHGTRMLSLIAGPETGAALGSPIQLVNFNVYPGGEGSSTTSGRIADAISQAVTFQAAHPGVPAVICLASGSSLGASSSLLASAVDEAVDAGITVIVSAGNEGANASAYIPSAYGTQAGVICVGASGENNQHLSNTNSGPAVDLYAPGQNVRTLALPNPQSGSYYLMNGTSPATALATAAAIIELSKNPDLSPAQVETALKSGSIASVSAPAPATSPAALIQVVADPEGDSDNDGTADVLEIFFGSNPADAAEAPSAMSLTRTAVQTQMAFNVSADLFNAATPFLLTNGGTWKVRCSENLTDWQDASGTLTAGAAVSGKIPLTFSMPGTAASCFLRIEVTPAP